MKIKYILIAIGLFIVYQFWTTYNAAVKFTYAVGRATDFNLLGGSVQWTQSVLVSNGDAKSVNIDGSNIKNYINGREVGSVILLQPQKILGNNSQNEVKFRVVIPYFDLAFLGMGVVDAINQKKLLIRFVGFIKTLNVDVPIDNQFIVQK